MGRSREFTQDQHARAFGEFRALAVEELLCDQIHSVPQRRDHADFRQRVEGRQIAERKTAVQELDRRVAETAEFAVDRAHLALHLLGQLIVFAHALPGWHGDQHEKHLVALVGMGFEETPHRREFLRHPLGVIEPLDIQDHPLAAQIVQMVRDERWKIRMPHLTLERRVVVADRIDAHAHLAAVVPDALHAGFPAQHLQQGGAEMPQIVVGVESDQIGAQHPLEHLGALGKHAEDLARTEWRVQEKPGFQIPACLAQHGGQQEKVVVVDPHHIALFRHLQDRLGEFPVHAAVGVPPVAGKLRALDHVVQQRPQRRIRISFVKTVQFLPCEENRDHAAAPHAIRQRRRVLDLLRRATGPADPQLLRTQCRPRQRGSQPALGAHQRTIRLDPHRQAVRHHDQPAHPL